MSGSVDGWGPSMTATVIEAHQERVLQQHIPCIALRGAYLAIRPDWKRGGN